MLEASICILTALAAFWTGYVLGKSGGERELWVTRDERGDVVRVVEQVGRGGELRSMDD